MFPRWQITRIDGKPIWGEYTWVDGGDDPAFPDWAWLDEDDGEVTYHAHWVGSLADPLTATFRDGERIQ